MNVLFLNSEGFDYLGSQLCEGFHLLSKEGKIKYKCLQKTTQRGEMVDDLVVTSIDEAVSSTDWADIILFNFGHLGSIPKEAQDVFRDPKLKHKRAFIDVYDNDQFIVDPDEQLLYFKREMRYPDCVREKKTNIRSIVFGVYQNMIDKLETLDPEDDWDNRDVDVSFMAFGGSSPVRIASISAIEKYRKLYGWNVECHVKKDGQPVPLEKYHDIMYRSKIGISIQGAGFDTHRFWDVPGHGAVLCSIDISTQLHMRNGFETHRHCIYFHSWLAMAEKCANIVSNKTRWVQMRRATDHHLRYHTTKSRATDVIKMCAEMISAKSFESSLKI